MQAPKHGEAGPLRSRGFRPATGAEAETGDGAGILIQIPDAFFRASVSFDLPPVGAYAVGMAFLPQSVSNAASAVATVEKITAEEGLRPLGWRDVPVTPDCLGKSARDVMPTFRQYFVDDPKGATGIDLDRKLFIVRKLMEKEKVRCAGAGAGSGGSNAVCSCPLASRLLCLHPHELNQHTDTNTAQHYTTTN